MFNLYVSVIYLDFESFFFLMQVWCILLSDKVPFRMQWPLHSDMQVNGNAVACYV